MGEVLDALGAVQIAAYGVLALVTFQRWLRIRDVASAWAAAMFAVLAGTVGAAPLIPDDAQSATKLLVSLLVLFPYLLFRFAAAFRVPGRRVEVVVASIAAVASSAVFLFEELPQEGEALTAGVAVYTVFVVAYWVGTSAVVAAWFWGGGAGRPTVVRLRLRTLAAAVAILAVALLLASAGGDGEAQPIDVFVALLAVIAAPLFLVGLAPPPSVLNRWRRGDEVALRRAEAGLVAATSPDEVASSLLPYVARTLGGDAAVLAAPDGRILASHGVDDEGAAALWRSAGSGDDVRRSLMSIGMRSGTLIVAGDRYAPFFGREERAVLERLGSLTDVALRRAAVTESERAGAAEVQRANVAIREFVSIASHDLRTPIAIVKGFADTLVDSWPALSDEDKLTHIGTIGRQADQLSRLVTDLLTVSQLDVGAIEPYLEAVDLSGLVTEVVADLGHEAEISIAPGTLVRADEDHASRIIRNLVENAAGYGQPPVQITARPVAGAVELRVRDHGAGVPEAFVPRLFERFSRAEASASLVRRGTGLGLSIVRGLARAGGGDAWYESAAPGACFAVRFPEIDVVA